MNKINELFAKSKAPYGTVILRTTFGNLYVYILATAIYVVKGKVSRRLIFS